MQHVERLDFSKPPPEWDWYDARQEHVVDVGTGRPGLLTNVDAWAHHRARHDPPGMWTLLDGQRPDQSDIWRMGAVGEARGDFRTQVEARAAAWKVYEDAVEVAGLLEDGMLDNGPPHPTWFERCAWPRPLIWTADQRAEVRRWREWNSKTGQKVARPPALPEVLRG